MQHPIIGMTRGSCVTPDQMKNKHQAVLALVIYQVIVACIETIDEIAQCQLLSRHGQVLCAQKIKKKKKDCIGIDTEASIPMNPVYQILHSSFAPWMLLICVMEGIRVTD